MRRGFGLITAIIFIVVIAILGTYALLITTQGAEESNDAYLKTQADILNASALDYALYRVRTSTDCIDENKVDKVLYKQDGSIKIKNGESFGMDGDCLFQSTIKYKYYNSNVCGTKQNAKLLTNHKMVVKAEAITTTCRFLDGWSGGNKKDVKTNKISSYGYKLIGK